MRQDEARGLLGVRPGAGPREVNRRFREQIRRHHPDTGGDPELFRRLVVARTALTERPDRPPLIVIPDQPWWRRLLRALLVHAKRRRAGRGARVR